MGRSDSRDVPDPGKVIDFGGCRLCKLLFELYDGTKQSPREYWVMTELYVALHHGKDWCDGDKTVEVPENSGG